MAGGRPATPTTSSSRTTRSAIKKRQHLEEVEVEGGLGVLTPTRKQQQKAGGVASSTSKSGSSRRLKNNSDVILHPPLPRPPSWQQGIATTFDNTLKSPRRRQRRTSNDERDPGDSVNSTEDEMELDNSPSIVASTSMMMMMMPPATPGKVNNKMIFKGETATPQTSSKSISDDEKRNICVCVRIRPSAQGAAEHDTPIWNIDSNTGKISLSENHPIIEKRKTVTDDAYDFKFDSLLVPPLPTSTMYEGHIRPVVSAAMEGYNGTIFSYGQTGSGKTHTMTGSDEEPGVLPLAISDIFQQISTDTERGYLLRVSYLEIYNETLKDLLEPVKQKNQELRVGEDKHGRIIVHNMKEEVVTSPQAVLEVLTRGEDNRSVNCTDWNQRSSRSHCVFSMTIESRPRKDIAEEDDVDESRGTPSPTEIASQSDKSKQSRGKIPVRISQLNLIDLAGSERATSQEERRKEGAFINKSLLSLGNVIQKLAEGKNGTSHIPYRDSKLTRLLQTSLSGNARIAIICTISPEARHGIESVSTLKFAQRASKIVTKAEQGIIYGPGALIAEYEETIANLQNQLADARKNNTQSHPVVHVEALEEERRRREQAEKEAKDYSMSVISLQSQIDHLKALMLTGSSGAGDSVGSSMPRTPSMAKRNYGDIGSGGRPNGPPGSHRRLSEMAFGIGSPLRNTGLPASSSMRSISSALEAMPNTQNDTRIRQLEEELASMRLALEKEQSTSGKTIEDLEAERQACKTRQVEGESEIERLRQLNQHLEDERHVAGNNLTSLEEQLSTSRSNEERLSNDHVKQMKQTEDLTSQLQDLRRLLSQREKRISELEENAATSGLSASAATTKLHQDLEKLRRTLDQTATAHAKESAASAEQILQAQKDLAHTQTRLDDKETELETLQEALSEAIEQAQDARANVERVSDDHKAIVEKLEAQMAILKRDQAQEVAEIDAEYRQNMKQLQKSLKQTEKDLAKYAKTLAEKEATISSLQKDLDMKEETIARLMADDTASRKSIEDLENAVQERQEVVSALTAACAEKDQRVISLKEELEKKEQARIRLASLKAANTPPDFGALQAKMQAVSSRSASKSLSNSLGSIDKAKTTAPSDVERALADTRAELQAAQKSLREAEKTIASSDLRVQNLLQAEKDYIKRIAELESAIAGFRKQIEANRKKLEELQSEGGDDLAKELGGLSLQAASPERKPPPPLKAVMPLGAMSPHRSVTSSNNASYRPSGLSTPTKKDSHGYAWNSRPDPLPLPPGTPEWRKQRRQTTEHELERLRTGGLASRNKTILQSPRLERGTMDWSSQSRPGSPSNQNSPMRVKKGSGGSNYSVY